MRPFCRATTTRNGADVICHRMFGHSGPHVERHRRKDDRRPDIEWFTAVPENPVRPSIVRVAPTEACPTCGCTPETLRTALRPEKGLAR